MSSGPRMVEVRQNVLKQNDLLARAESVRAIGSLPPKPRPKWLREYILGFLGIEDY